MQIPILSGVYTDNGPDIRLALPVNMVPVLSPANGVSNAYLRPADGLVQNGSGPGIVRGGINWNGVCYRVMGSKLVSIASDGTVTTLGEVGNDNKPVTMDYGYLALPGPPPVNAQCLIIASATNLFYWTGSSLIQVSDQDLGIVLDCCWIDGYVLTTDGEYVVSTDLLNSTSVIATSYTSTDNDPDPIVALIHLHDEVYAINRNTIQVLKDTGTPAVGSFTFSLVDGGRIMKGAVGTKACCIFLDQIAFLGSGRNETCAIYLASNSQTTKISSQEIDQLLESYTEEQLSQTILETRIERGRRHLYVHLPDRTVVYDASTSEEGGQQIWFTLTSTLSGFSQYRARHMVWCYDQWLVGDPRSTMVGYMTPTSGDHWGQPVRWEFGTLIVYNEGNGALFNELELVTMTGRVLPGVTPTISTSYSTDGMSWSQDRVIQAGLNGQTKKRLAWFQQGHMRNWRIQRFRGDTQAHLSFARLEAKLEGLAY